jgi:hypothetical protein
VWQERGGAPGTNSHTAAARGDVSHAAVWWMTGFQLVAKEAAGSVSVSFSVCDHFFSALSALCKAPNGQCVWFV